MKEEFNFERQAENGSYLAESLVQDTVDLGRFLSQLKKLRDRRKKGGRSYLTRSESDRLYEFLCGIYATMFVYNIENHDNLLAKYDDKFKEVVGEESAI